MYSNIHDDVRDFELNHQIILNFFGSFEKIISQGINLNTSVNVHLRESLTLLASWISRSCIEVKIKGKLTQI